MFKNAKILFYFNQYFVIRLGEKVYSYTPEIERFSVLRAFGSLLLHCYKNLNTFVAGSIAKPYKRVVYIETINQKNAIIDVFSKMSEAEKNDTLFILNNNLKMEGFVTASFNNRKLFLLGLLHFPKALCISKQYIITKKGVINRAHIYVNLALFMASVKLFEQYIQVTKCEKVILTNDHNLQPLGLLLAARNKNVVSYYIQHAAVSEAFPKLLPNVALLEGQQAVETYHKIGNLSRIQKLVGIARMDGLLAQKTVFKSKDIVVGFCLKPYYSMELIKEIIDSIRASANVSEIILRPHPGNSEAFYKTLSSLNITISNAKQERPHEFLRKTDVMISGESSILLEAALMKVKTIYIDDKIAQFDLYGFVRNGITTAVKESAEITTVLNLLSYDEVEKQYQNCQYYCSTVNTENENNSKALILNYLLQ
jgi:hypothetical protein